MAGQYMTLGEVKAAALYRGDLEGMLDRHPSVNQNQEANLSYRDLRVKLANADMQQVLSPTAILSLPVAEAVAGGGYAELDWPVDAVSVHGIDVKVGGYWWPLQQGQFSQRRLGPIERGDYSFADELGAQWIQRSLPTTAGASQIAGKIMLMPVPTGGQYVMWYLPQWVDLVLDTDLFPGQESWLQWVVWDLACKLLIRDTGPQASEQLNQCIGGRERAWAIINTATQRLAQDGPIVPRSRYRSQRGGYRLIP